MKNFFFGLFCFSIASVAGDVCDLDDIYHEQYRYSLPRPILESFLSGKAFDYKEFYTEEELGSVKTDIQSIFSEILQQSPDKDKVAIMTAGGPGAGKTILMKQHKERENRHYAYICPDDVCLQKMTLTYQKHIASVEKTKINRLFAYNKWRPASNAATHLILARLIQDGYGFYFGTTSTAPQTALFLNFLKKQGYRICLLHITAKDDVRWQSIQERDKTFVQTTEADVREKGLLFPQRIQDTYLKYADEIEFYYRDAVKEDAILAAKWTKELDGSCHLENFSSSGYANIKDIHDNMARSLNREDLLWENTVEKSIH